MISTKTLAAGVATTTLAALLAGAAWAQSTATQVQEVVVTGSHAEKSVGGLITQVQQAGDISIINQQFIQSQQPSANFAELINLLPGVSYSSEDPTGLLSGDLRVHSFTGNQVAVSIDGSPVNDTGNYAVYPGEYLVGELTDRVRVNLGGSDVDTPSAAALGASIDIRSKIPDATPSATAKVSAGDYNYHRVYGELDTGAVGPTGLRSYFAFNYADSDKWKGSGDVERIGGDFRLYQPLKGTDFISLAGTYVSERSYLYYDASRAQVATIDSNADYRDIDYNTVYVNPTARSGVADTVPTAAAYGIAGINGSNSNYYLLHPNPVDFATIRGSSKFTLAPNLTLTVDPSFFYTIANGGGATAVSETDKRLIGSTSVTGVDLNGDGDTKDSVLLYTPSNTNTRRWVLLSSLIYDLDHHNEFTLTYTGDYGLHRQTGEATYIYGGAPDSVFGGKDGYGDRVYTADGSFLRTRDRYSKAILNQVSANYIGKFLDDNLHLNLGLRAPFFQRDLHQYCYTYNGTSQYCDTVSQSSVLAAYNAGVAAHNATALSSLLGVTVNYNSTTGTPNFRMPYSQRFDFNKVLPNVGATYRLGEPNLFYLSYNQGFAAPKTDDLYTSATDLVKPETTDNFEGGYRFQNRMVTASISGWANLYHNRIVQSYDPTDPTLSIDRNIGDVDVYGLDAEIGVTPIHNLNLYASMTLEKSELQNDLTVVVSGKSTTIPTSGKELVLTPDRTFAGRAQYRIGPVVFGVQGKYESSRWVTDVNDARIPGFATFDGDIRYDLPLFNDNTYIQFNVKNMLDRFYITRGTTANTANGVTTSAGTYTGSTLYDYIGAPRTFFVTLQTKF